MLPVNKFTVTHLYERVSLRDVCFKTGACADPEVGGGSGSRHPEKHKAILFLSNTGLHPMKNHQASKSAFNVGPSSPRQRNAI